MRCDKPGTRFERLYSPIGIAHMKYEQVDQSNSEAGRVATPGGTPTRSRRAQSFKRMFIFTRETEQSKAGLFLPPHLNSVFALPGKTQSHRNDIFSLKCSITVFQDFCQKLIVFFQCC